MSGILESFVKALFPPQKKNIEKKMPKAYSEVRASQWEEGTLGNLLFTLRKQYSIAEVDVYKGEYNPKTTPVLLNPLLRQESYDPRYGRHDALLGVKVNELCDTVLSMKVLRHVMIFDRIDEWKNMPEDVRRYYPRLDEFLGTGEFPKLYVWVEYVDDSILSGKKVYEYPLALSKPEAYWEYLKNPVAFIERQHGK